MIANLAILVSLYAKVVIKNDCVRISNSCCALLHRVYLVPLHFHSFIGSQSLKITHLLLPKVSNTFSYVSDHKKFCRLNLL